MMILVEDRVPSLTSYFAFNSGAQKLLSKNWKGPEKDIDCKKGSVFVLFGIKY